MNTLFIIKVKGERKDVFKWSHCDVIQRQVVALWGWWFCKDNASLMLGHSYMISSVQLEYCSLCSSEPTTS